MAQRKLKAKALLIDLDGTIVDSIEAFDAAAKTAFSSIGYNQNLDNAGLEIAILLQRNFPLNSFFKEKKITEDLKEKFLTVFLQSFYEIATSKTKLFPNVDKTLCMLSKDFLLALITRRHISKRHVEKELQRLHIDSCFRTIVTALDVEKPTPSPDTILKAADELQMPVHYCVVISDSGVDIQAGKSAGAKTVAVLSGLFKKEELRKEKPDLIVKDITHLPEHLLAMNRRSSD